MKQKSKIAWAWRTMALSLLCLFAALPAKADYYVAGTPTSVFGSEWNASYTSNKMTNYSGNYYYLRKTGVSSGTSIEFKVTNGSWSSSWGSGGGSSNYSYSVPSNSTGLVITFNSSTPSEINAYSCFTVVGEGCGFFGTDWTTGDTNYDMTTTDGINFTLTKTGVTLTSGSIKYKIAQDHSWDKSYPSSDQTLSISSSGTYDVTFTFNSLTKAYSATATKQTVTVEAPTFSPASGGSYTDLTHTVSLSTTTSGASIYYTMTTNGNDPATPTASSTPYSSPIALNSEATYKIKAIAIKNGTSSSVSSATYTVALDKWSVVGSNAVLFTGSGGTWDNDQDMTNTSGTTWTKTWSDVQLSAGGVEFKVRKNHSWGESYASDPKNNGNCYENITEAGYYDVTINFDSDTKAVTWSFTRVDCDAPTFSPAEGTYYDSQSVTISAASGATIYYTTNGNNPTTSSQVYSSPIVLSNGTTTIKAMASKGGHNSAVTSGTYTLSASTWTLAGDKTLFGGENDFDPSLTANDMINSNGTYTKTYSAVSLTAGTIRYKVVKNHDWSAGEYPGSNQHQELSIPATGVYDVTFTYDGSSTLTATATLLSLAAPTFSPASGTVANDSQVVTISGPAGSTIYYTIDGRTTPTTSSPLHGEAGTGTATVTITASTTVMAIAHYGTVASSVGQASYTINASVFNVAGNNTAFFGSDSWNLNVATNEMTSNGDGTYTWTSQAVQVAANTTVEYKVARNHDFNNGEWPSSGNASVTINDAGWYTLTINFDWNNHSLTPVVTRLDANAPTFTPASGTTFSNLTSTVALSGDSEATIRYTIASGSTPADPTASTGTVYSSPIALDQVGTYTIKAITVKNGYASAVATATYTVAFKTIKAIGSIDNGNGGIVGWNASGGDGLVMTTSDGENYTGVFTVKSDDNGYIAFYDTANTGSDKWYRTNNNGSNFYITDQLLDTYLGAQQGNNYNWYLDPGVYSFTLNISVPNLIVSKKAVPIYTPAPGTYNSTQSVTIEPSKSGATIYYTMTSDGSDPATPTTASTQYSSPISLNAQGTYKFKAIAVENGESSAVVEATYTIAFDEIYMIGSVGTDLAWDLTTDEWRMTTTDGRYYTATLMVNYHSGGNQGYFLMSLGKPSENNFNWDNNYGNMLGSNAQGDSWDITEEHMGPNNWDMPVIQGSKKAWDIEHGLYVFTFDRQEMKLNVVHQNGPMLYVFDSANPNTYILNHNNEEVRGEAPGEYMNGLTFLEDGNTKSNLEFYSTRISSSDCPATVTVSRLNKTDANSKFTTTFASGATSPSADQYWYFNGTNYVQLTKAQAMNLMRVIIRVQEQATNYEPTLTVTNGGSQLYNGLMTDRSSEYNHYWHKKTFLVVSENGLSVTVKSKADNNSSEVTLSETGVKSDRFYRVENGQLVSVPVATLRNEGKGITIHLEQTPKIEELTASHTLGLHANVQGDNFDVTRGDDVLAYNRSWYTFHINQTIGTFNFFFDEYNNGNGGMVSPTIEQKSGSIWYTWKIDDYSQGSNKGVLIDGTSIYELRADTVPDCAAMLEGYVYVYYTDLKGWGDDSVYVHTWSPSATGDWPGKQMTKVGYDDDGHPVYVYVFGKATEGAVLPEGILFNNGVRDNQSNDKLQTGDFDFELGGTYDYIGGMYSLNSLAGLISREPVGGAKRTVSDDLVAVYYDSKNKVLYCKDKGNYVNKSENLYGKTDYMSNYMSNYYSSNNYGTYAEYDQSNWVKIVAAEGSGINLDATYHTTRSVTLPALISKSTVNGAFTNLVNPEMHVTNIGAPQSTTNVLNVYVSANFNDTLINVETNNTDFYFTAPKPNEVCEITWVVFKRDETKQWTGTGSDKGAFYAPREWNDLRDGQREGTTMDPGQHANGYNLYGGFDVDWSMWNGSSAYSSVFEDGQAYHFLAVVKLKEDGVTDYGAVNFVNTGNGAPRRKANAGQDIPAKTDYTTSSKYIVCPVDVIGTNGGVVTDVKDNFAEKKLVKTSYFNLMGIESATPFSGVNIVVRHYDDGSRASSKVLYK